MSDTHLDFIVSCLTEKIINIFVHPVSEDILFLGFILILRLLCSFNILLMEILQENELHERNKLIGYFMCIWIIVQLTPDTKNSKFHPRLKTILKFSFRYLFKSTNATVCQSID